MKMFEVIWIVIDHELKPVDNIVYSSVNDARAAREIAVLTVSGARVKAVTREVGSGPRPYGTP